MKALHVIPAIAARYGGPSRAILDLLKALSGVGIEVALATTDADGAGRLGVEIGQRVETEGVPTWFFRRQASEAFKLSFPLARWLARNAGEFDLIHAHAVFSHSTVAAASAARAHGKPLVVRPLGTLSPWSLAQKPLRKRLALAAGIHGILRSSTLHYTSRAEREAVEATLGLADGWVLPLGVDSDFFAIERKPAVDSPFVVSHGRLHPKKRLVELVAAFAEATESEGLRHWRLVIAGEGDARYAGRIAEAAGASSAAERIELPGWVGGEALFDLLARASLFALPSHHENFGLAAAEAMAAGLPVLLSPGVELAPEVTAGQCGWVLQGGPETLADTLRQALLATDDRLRRGEAARRRASERFAWPEVARSLVERYTDLLATEQAA